MRLGLLLLIGIPASGKTTLSKTLKCSFECYNNNEFHFIHICYDDLISYKNQNEDFEWKVVRNLLIKKIENLIVAIKSKSRECCPLEFLKEYESIKKFDSNIVLILDDNMYFRSMRYSLYQVARKHSIGFCQVYIHCPLEDALLKNSLRTADSITPPYIIENMHNKLEPPNIGNMWERFSVQVEAFCDVNKLTAKLFPILETSLVNFVSFKQDNKEEREFCSLQCKTSVLHQTDIALRNIVGSKIKNFLKQSSKEESKRYIEELNTRKCEILCDIKMGNICLPDKIIDEISQDILEKSELISFLISYF